MKEATNKRPSAPGMIPRNDKPRLSEKDNIEDGDQLDNASISTVSTQRSILVSNQHKQTKRTVSFHDSAASHLLVPNIPKSKVTLSDNSSLQANKTSDTNLAQSTGPSSGLSKIDFNPKGSFNSLESSRESSLDKINKRAKKKLSSKSGKEDNSDTEQCSVLRISGIHLEMYDTSEQDSSTDIVSPRRKKLQFVSDNAVSKIKVAGRRISTAASAINTTDFEMRKTKSMGKQVSFVNVKPDIDEASEPSATTDYLTASESSKKNHSWGSLKNQWKHKKPKRINKDENFFTKEQDRVVKESLENQLAKLDEFATIYNDETKLKLQNQRETSVDNEDTNARLYEILEARRRASSVKSTAKTRCPCTCL